MVKWFKEFFKWVWDEFQEFGFMMLEALFGTFSAPGQPGTDSFWEYVCALNYYLPIDFSVSLLFLYFTFNTGWLLYKHVKSWIPTVGSS